MRLGLLIASFVALSIAAVTGWTRHAPAGSAAVPATNSYMNNAPAENPAVPANTANCVAPVPAGPGTAVSPVYATLPYGNSNPVETSYATQPAPPPPAPEPSAAQYVAPSYSPRYMAPPVVVRHRYVAAPVRTRRVVYYRRIHHKRPFSHSVAIVAGTMAAGAGIGALAGGGRGAGIGALAGGVGGVVYDRLTH